MGSGERDYIAIAMSYAKKVLADKKRKRNGLRMQQAAQRFLDDLKRAKRKDPPFVFSEEHAIHACAFLEMLPHVEGKWETPEVILHPSQVLFVVNLFGFRKHDGTRRFTSALLCQARKNGKSFISAGILLYCMCCEDEPGAQVITAATTFQQASVIFKVAKAIVQRTPDLADAYGLQTWSQSISRMEIGASFKALHAKASTQDGLNPSHVGLDEIHAHKTSDLLNVLTSAAGARSCPLWLYTTTEGHANAGPWSEIREFAKKLLDGVFADTADHFLAFIFAVDDGDDDFSEDAWHKANPLIEGGHGSPENPHLLASIRKGAVEAKAMPSQLAEFQIKRLNRPASVAGGFILIPKWRACNAPVDLEFLRDYPCWAGLDLASTRDITALRVVWKVEGKVYTWGRRWVPRDAVHQRTERGTVPYAGWVAAKLIEQTDGDVTDYSVIERAVLDLHENFNLQGVGFDRWNATEVSSRLIDAGVPMLEFVQGPKSYHPAMQELERLYISGNLAHGGDPVLEWNASNMVARTDVNLNMAPDKKRSADKIDDMVALLMAVGLSMVPIEDNIIHQGFVSL